MRFTDLNNDDNSSAAREKGRNERQYERQRKERRRTGAADTMAQIALAVSGGAMDKANGSLRLEGPLSRPDGWSEW
jgi:hypothetical protein